MVVFTVFFGRLAGLPAGDLPYPVFVYAGLLPWTFFAAAITTGSQSVLGAERLITKVYFPRLALPFAAVAAAVVDFAVAFGLMLVLMLTHGVWPGPAMLLLPLILAILMVMALGIAALLAGLNVAYRDFRYVTPFLIQLWMFGTPSIYMATGGSGHGEVVRWLLALNPLTGLIDAFRAACLGGPIPWLSVGVGAACAAVTFLVGCFWFRKVEAGFADVI
jgi:lipopolysaccharide transport system permease protein